MEAPIPLFTVVDNLIRIGLILFLALYAVRFRCWLMFVVLGISSVTLYSVFILGIPSDNLFLQLSGQVVAFILVYMLYEYMRMKSSLRGLVADVSGNDRAQEAAMDDASSKKINIPNTRDNGRKVS